VYCYNSKERAKLQEKSLPLEIATAGIDEYFADNKSRHIRFYGPGEPTQEFELMRQITDYARQKGGDAVTTELQTNGAFSPKVREWILENLNIVWVSFDGMPDIQNKQRPFPNTRDKRKAFLCIYASEKFDIIFYRELNKEETRVICDMIRPLLPEIKK
jgi:sulfatase maturation enzyme AslB (radical SAM superfamily)